MGKTINIEKEQDQKVDQPFVIGISGACGSGKTWFANKLREEIVKPVCIFALDCYSKDKDFVNELEYHYDNPLAIDYDKAYIDLSKLIQGETISLPIYDYVSHRVISEKFFTSPSVIIIEGLYSFYDERFLDAMNFKIWIETDNKTCLERRVKRDVGERGETMEGSMFRHINDSEPAFREFYAKGRKCSDCIYDNSKRDKIPFLVTILKKYVENK